MIKTKSDYLYYLKADEVALNVPDRLPGRLVHRIVNYVWKFERLLRKAEYYHNCKRSLIWTPYRLYLHYQLLRSGARLGFHIPLNVFGPGLSIAHVGPVIVNGGARVGRNCRIHNCVHIGTAAGYSGEAPEIGDDVFIGPGAQIFGRIKIADGIAIGANAVVNRSFDEPGISIAGIPARKISDKGSKGFIIRATERLPPRQ